MYKIEKNGAFSNSLNYLRMTYQIPLSMDKPYLKKFVAIYLLTKMVCFFFTLIGPLLFLIVIIVTHSETDISEATSVTIGGTAAFLVNVLFTLKYKQWSDFFKDLEDLKKFGEPASYQKTLNFLNRLGHISIFGSSMVTFIYGLAAWCNTKFNKEFNEDFDQISPVLVPIWLPFGANNLTAGTIIFTMQIIFTGILTSQSFLIQSFIIYESTEILICYISHLNDNFKETFEASSKAEMRRRLGFCVDYHVHLLKLGYRLSSLIKYTAGHVSLLSALVCGCVANQILTTKPIGSFIFLTAWLFAIFSYCHGGQRIKDKTMSIGDALYESKWYNADNETMKDVQFILMRCQKPICYEAIPLGITDYPFYYMMIKTGYSYFTLLNHST